MLSYKKEISTEKKKNKRKMIKFFHIYDNTEREEINELSELCCIM